MAAALLAVGVLTGCGTNHRLAEYDFTGGTVNVASLRQPPPDVLSELELDFDSDDPVGSVIRLGAGIAREVSLDSFRNRLDSAVARVDMADRMAERTLDRVNRYLVTRPWNTADGDPDFQVELRIRTYGFTADEWDSGVYLALDGTMVLVDGATGQIVWEADVTEREPLLSTSLRSESRAAGDVLTAFGLSRMSTRDIVYALEALSDFTVDALTDALRDDLDDVRRD